MAPPQLDRIITKCLAKDPESRWQSVRDLRDELEWIAGSSVVSEGVMPSARSRWRERIAWTGALTLLGVLLLAVWLKPSPPAQGPIRFAVYPPPGHVLAGGDTTIPVPEFALSPDGRTLVFAATAGGGTSQLWLRPIDDVNSRVLQGTEDATAPFWSPDGRWIGFFASGKIKKIPRAGGPVQVVEGVHRRDAFGGSWGNDDTILYSMGNGTIYQIPAAGGSPRQVTKLDEANNEAGHRWPQFLPDGQHLLFLARAPNRAIFAGSIDGKTRKFILRSDTAALYAPPGYLLYVDGDTLLGRAFDAERTELKGEPFTVAERVGRSAASEGAVSASSSGALAYSQTLLRPGRLTWYDRLGNEKGPITDVGDYPDFRLSPDEKRLAVTLFDAKRNALDVWLNELAERRSSRFSDSPLFNATPVWSPDGARIIFRSSPRGASEFVRKSAFGSGSAEPVLTLETMRSVDMRMSSFFPSDWSPDGRHILFVTRETWTGYDIYLLPAEGNSKPAKLLASSSDEMHANFSPDGRFWAYSSNESGRFQVYVQTFPLSDHKWTISTDGGYEPRWRGDGRELYYLSEDRKLMSVEVGTGPRFGVPKTLFQTRVHPGLHALRTNYVPSRDGQRFLINVQSSDLATQFITVVLNWTAAIRH